VTTFIQVLIAGLGQGSVYAIMALGLTLILRSTTVLNFSHGALYMASAFIALELIRAGVSYAFAVVISVAAVALIGAIINFVAFQPLLHKEHVTQVFATFAVSSIIIGIVGYVTVDQRGMPPILPMQSVRVGSITFNPQYLIMIGVLVVAGTALALFFRYTRAGVVIRASTDNLRGATLVGINVRRVFLIMWTLGATLAAIAGILAAPTTLVSATMGETPMIAALAAMTLGGFGSIPGSVVGGLLMGLLETGGNFYVSTQLGGVAGFVAVFLLLVIRPRGLQGSGRHVEVRRV
jgi:branched-chain amino acid transport system permease protein